MTTILSGAAFVFAILYAKGWIVTANAPNAVALIALGLLIPCIAAALAWAPSPRPPRREPPSSP